MLKLSTLIEGKKEIFKYKDTLEGYLKQLRPSIKGWKFSVDYHSGAWEWSNRKFEDAVYATWGWEGQNEIPIETSDGVEFKAVKLKLKPSTDTTDEKQLKKDAMNYIKAMQKEFPKIQKKMLEY